MAERDREGPGVAGLARLDRFDHGVVGKRARGKRKKRKKYKSCHGPRSSMPLPKGSTQVREFGVCVFGKR